MEKVRRNPQGGVAANYAARNLRKSDLGGVIFGCKHNTIKECLTKQIFGLPAIHYSYIRNIEQGLPLFLFNYSDRQLHGIFEAAGPGQMNIDPYAWSEDGHIRTPFPAQVQICTRTQCIPIPENQFKKIIADNYYKDFHFWFELDHSQTKQLMALFKPGTRYANKPVMLPFPPTKKVQNNISYKKTLLKDQNEKYENNVWGNESENYENNEWGNNSENYENNNGCVNKGNNNWADQVEWEQENDINNNNINNNNNDNYNGNYNEDSTQFKTPPNEINWGNEDYSDKNNHNSSQLGFGYQDSKDDEWSSYTNTNGKDNEWSTYTNTNGKDNEWSPYTNPNEKNNEWVAYNKNPNNKNPNEKINEWVAYNNPNGKDNEWGAYNDNNVKEFGYQKNNEWGFNNNNNKTNVKNKDIVYETALSKLRAIVLEKKELKGCVTEKEVKFPEEPFDMGFAKLPQTNIELVQLVQQMKIKTIEMEKKQIESEKEIERLNDIVIKSGENIFILENRVAELETTLQSTLTSTNKYDQPEKVIYLIGGFNGSKWLSSFDAFVPSKDKINALTEMDCSRSYASVSMLGDGIFVCGGGDGSSWFDTVECYKKDTEQWIQCPSLSSEKGSLAGLALNGKIYAIGGGNDQTCFSEVEMFDPILGKWIKTHSMLEKRFAPAAVEFNGAIYTVGGYDGKVYLQTTERYDPREGHWVRLASMNTRRGCPSLAAIGVLLYCVGGYDGEKMVSTMETFDPRLSTWVPGRPMSHPRGYAASAIFDDNFYVFGGLSMGDKILDTVECFNQRTGWFEPGFKSVGKRCFTSAIAL